MSFTATALPEPYNSTLDRLFHGKNAFLEYNPGKCLFPESLKDYEDDILNLKVRPDDTFFFSYPRTGSTWCAEMIWLINNDLDFELAKTELLHTRIPLIETSAIFFEDWAKPFMDKFGNSVEVINSRQSPRSIRSHLPLPLLPKGLQTVKPKIIYIGRNPKDVCVSYYYHCGSFHGMTATFEEFCELFLVGMLPYGDLIDHMLEFWKIRDQPNVLFLKYEDVKADLSTSLTNIASFLEKKIPDDKMDLLIDHLSFKNMKNNSACNLDVLIKCRWGEEFSEKSKTNLMRKGEVGDWKNMMSPELAARFDGYVEEKTKGTGLFFK